MSVGDDIKYVASDDEEMELAMWNPPRVEWLHQGVLAERDQGKRCLVILIESAKRNEPASVRRKMTMSSYRTLETSLAL